MFSFPKLCAVYVALHTTPLLLKPVEEEILGSSNQQFVSLSGVTFTINEILTL